MSRGHALIVDDSSTARLMLARMLDRLDISSEGVVSAEDAFDFLDDHQVDYIFLDHLLPGMNGFEALQILKTSPKMQDIPVFMYTSQNTAPYRTEAAQLGAAGVIGKQLDRDQLQQALEAISSGIQPTETTAIPLPMQQDTTALPEASPSTPTPAPAESNISSDSVMLKRLTGRLSTLEIAYEEVADELHQLRLELAQSRADEQVELARRQRRMRWLNGLMLLLIIGLGAAVWYQYDALQTLLRSVNNQSGVLRDIIGQLMELMGHS
ncbi:response regulator [Mangrovitalea sediminis]|uniref:response regulator n=1 Tax=Mangrovitalea sediminis TaxID=1982043 RepID=UPI000BE4D520|nr:response regulator [Mangrovitalea sediminis]